MIHDVDVKFEQTKNYMEAFLALQKYGYHKSEHSHIQFKHTKPNNIIDFYRAVQRTWLVLLYTI